MRIDGITDNDSYKIFISISLLILFCLLSGLMPWRQIKKA